MSTLVSLRIDKWLWCARFYKTRSLAAEEITKGRVTVNGLAAKASREVRPGDTVVLPGVMSRKKQIIPMLTALWG